MPCRVHAADRHWHAGLHWPVRGENRFQIARFYDVPVAALAQWNPPR
jgi:hypothetical protein